MRAVCAGSRSAAPDARHSTPQCFLLVAAQTPAGNGAAAGFSHDDDQDTAPAHPATSVTASPAGRTGSTGVEVRQLHSAQPRTTPALRRLRHHPRLTRATASHEPALTWASAIPIMVTNMTTAARVVENLRGRGGGD